MRAYTYVFIGLVMFVLNIGCESAKPSAGPAAVTSSSVEGGKTRHRDPGTSLARTYRSPTGAQDVRVLLEVVPGDAVVEVDETPVRRRQGLIELVGRVGDVHRVRAAVGDRWTEEISVRIGPEGPSPTVIDAAVVKAGVPKKKPVRFLDP